MTDYRAQLTGVFTALVTPFKGDAVDYEAFDALVERQLAAGIAGLVPVGTTGEAATLSDDEAAEVIARTVKLAAGRCVVMAGAGANDTRTAVAKAIRAEAAGADMLLVVTPYYNKPSQAGLIAHYQAIAAATSLPIVLYSVPGRCGVEIAPETCKAILDTCPNVVAIKEAGGSVDRVTKLRLACGDRLVIHSGDDALTVPFLSAGAVGVTSVVANYAPQAMVDLVRAWQAGDTARALVLHEQLSELTAAMFIEANPGPVKAALAHAGFSSPDMRLPMVAMSDANRSALVQTLGRFQASFQEIR
ncbi:4-hydroxy-tetrahydrodipicolinate synthase [Devosia sp. 2618]|uniref:4-hydroxy-tetrahydrodipicolinate synthase n=1 Tax=Devosia sp. 2618 TaxID=3156454 RepID=UPI003399A7A4